jgi:hypothetical protein
MKGPRNGTLLLGFDRGRPTYLSLKPRTHQTVLKVELDDESAGRIGDFAAHFGSDLQCSVKLDAPLSGDDLPEQLTGKVRRSRAGEKGDVLAEHATLQVTQVFYHQPLFEPEATAADDAGGNAVDYLLFGDAETGLYLAHLLRDLGDFDQLLRVQINGETFTETEIERQGRPTVQVADAGADRLSAGQTVQAHSSAGQHHHRDIEVVVRSEV